MREAPVVLISTAHPDDETFGSGGTSALLAARGVPVHVLLATSGQAGEITDPALDTPANRADLGALREAEARAAGAVVGLAGIVFLGHWDGRLAEVGDERLAREVATVIRRLRPAVVITFGPEGIYGHPDHLAVHRATRLAWDLAADPALDLDGLPAHGVARLFYQAISAELAARRNAERGPVDLGGNAHPFVGYPDEAITTRIDASAYTETKLAALAAHRSQTAARREQIAAMLRAEPLVERFVLAERRVPDAPGLATDLLAGLA
jgi:N-acetyl-1-D-myo-inositol-2-amino-2-deoxy-alpha-D-glucopyranoside deacetylase